MQDYSLFINEHRLKTLQFLKLKIEKKTFARYQKKVYFCHLLKKYSINQKRKRYYL